MVGKIHEQAYTDKVVGILFAYIFPADRVRFSVIQINFNIENAL